MKLNIKKLSKKKIIIISLFVVAVALIGVFVYKKTKSKNTSNVAQTFEVNIQKGTVSNTVSVSGQVESANYLSITTSVNGIVKEVFVKEGDTVVKGQKIMEVTLSADGEESLAQAWASYLSAKSSLESSKKQLISLESSLIQAEESFEEEKENNSYQSHDERVSYKLAENAYTVAKQSYDLQKSDIEQKEISLNKAWLEYQAQSSTIVAPDSGTISNVVVVEGMDISNSLSERTSFTVASIKKEGTPIATLNVTEVDIAKIQVGQAVKMTLNSTGDEVFTGTVAGIDKVGTSSSGVANYPVIVKFDEPNDAILPNMGVEAEVILEEKEGVLLVPTSSITTMQGKKYVNVPDGKESRQVEITVGISSTDYTEVISGLNEGDTVLVSSFPTQGFTSDNSSNNMGPGGGMGGMGIMR